MSGMPRAWLYWAGSSAAGMVLSYTFAEYFLLPGLQQTAALMLGFATSCLIPLARYRSMLLGATLGFVSTLIAVLVLGSFNHPGDRSLVATFLTVNFLFFLLGAIVSLKVIDARGK